MQACGVDCKRTCRWREHERAVICSDCGPKTVLNTSTSLRGLVGPGPATALPITAWSPATVRSPPDRYRCRQTHCRWPAHNSPQTGRFQSRQFALDCTGTRLRQLNHLIGVKRPPSLLDYFFVFAVSSYASRMWGGKPTPQSLQKPAPGSWPSDRHSVQLRVVGLIGLR